MTLVTDAFPSFQALASSGVTARRSARHPLAIYPYFQSCVYVSLKMFHCVRDMDPLGFWFQKPCIVTILSIFLKTLVLFMTTMSL